jgi:hypothetical protein
MSIYVTVGGDSLPSIAERCDHAGEWQALAEANAEHIWADYNNLQPGLELVLPAEWLLKDAQAAEAVFDEAEVIEMSTFSAADLVDLASSASTLAELDAIDAASNGRVTVQNAVAARRSTLLDQGATA